MNSTLVPGRDTHDLRVSLPWCIPMGLPHNRLGVYLERQRIVEEKQTAWCDALPAWDATKPLTAAVLKAFAAFGARQATTDPESGNLVYSQVRDHDMTLTTLPVRGAQRRVTAQDLLVDQFSTSPADFGGGARSPDLFLSALSGAPAAFRIRRSRKVKALNTMKPVSVRVLVFLDGPCQVQFHPEYTN